MNSIKPDVLDYFGLRYSPFGELRSPDEYYESPEFRRAYRMIQYAIESYEVVALVGDVGSGKSGAVSRAAAMLEQTEGLRAEFVRIFHPEKESLRIGSAMEALLGHLAQADTLIPQSVQKRVLLLRFHLIQAHQAGRRICLIIDEAHRLPGRFLKSLKELQESMRFGHNSSLFGVVLLGHERLIERYQKIAKDVWDRLDAGNLALMGTMIPSEVVEYISHRCKAAGAADLFSESARLAVGRLVSSPLAINQICWRLMEFAYTEGLKTVDERDVLAAYSRGQLARMLGLSLADIANTAGIGKTTVGDVLQGKGSTASKEAVDDALSDGLKGF